MISCYLQSAYLIWDQPSRKKTFLECWIHTPKAMSSSEVQTPSQDRAGSTKQQQQQIQKTTNVILLTLQQFLGLYFLQKNSCVNEIVTKEVLPLLYFYSLSLVHIYHCPFISIYLLLISRWNRRLQLTFWHRILETKGLIPVF